MSTVVTSKRFSLNLNDWWKGLIMAVAAPTVAVIIDSISDGNFNIDWSLVWKTALGAFLAYITKNLFTGPAVVIKDVDNDTVDAVAEGRATARITTR